MADSIKFSRQPYTVKYVDLKGELQSYRRRPPPKLHQGLPQDVVRLDRGKNAAFEEGGDYKIKHINPRHPNVLQLQNSDGLTTFVEHYDVTLQEEVAFRDGVDPRDQPKNSKYLLWP